MVTAKPEAKARAAVAEDLRRVERPGRNHRWRPDVRPRYLDCNTSQTAFHGHA